MNNIEKKEQIIELAKASIITLGNLAGDKFERGSHVPLFEDWE